MPVATDLEAALPAAFVAGLTQVTVVGQVYVDRVERVESNAVAVYIATPDSFELTDGGLADPELRRVYTVRIEKQAGTKGDLEEFAREAIRHFHGKRSPNVTGLRRMLVEAVVGDLFPEEGPAVAVLFDLVALTREPQTTG